MTTTPVLWDEDQGFLFGSRGVSEENVLVLEDASCITKTVSKAAPRDRDAGASGSVLLSGLSPAFLTQT